MSDNRIDPNAAPSTLPSAGVPVLPVKLVPILIALGAIAVAVEQFAPPYTMAYKIAGSALVLLGLFGIASPGLRKR